MFMVVWEYIKLVTSLIIIFKFIQKVIPSLNNMLYKTMCIVLVFKKI